MTYSYDQLVALAQQAGANLDQAQRLAAIALAESGGDPTQVNPTDNGGTQTSWGLWQISDGTHNAIPGWSDPLTNATLALGKLNTQGWTAWGTFSSGAYEQYLPGGAAQSAGGGALPMQSATGTFVPRDLPSNVILVIAAFAVLVVLLSMRQVSRRGVLP
jgi:Lysozyme like domain